MCEIHAEDGRVFPIFALVDGHVIEINEAVLEDPNILLNSVKNFSWFFHSF